MLDCSQNNDDEHVCPDDCDEDGYDDDVESFYIAMQGILCNLIQSILSLELPERAPQNPPPCFAR